MNIFDVIKQETKGFSGKTAVIEGSSSISYGELISCAEIFASLLREKTVGQFHRVGLLCADSIDYIIASLAVLSLSAVVVPVSPEQTIPEINAVIDSMALNFLIFEKGAYSHKNAQSLQVNPVREHSSLKIKDGGIEPPSLRNDLCHRQESVAFSNGVKGLRKKEFYLLKRENIEEPCKEYYKINPAFIRFSSGTTGRSKGIVLSHEAIMERTDSADKGLKITPGDTVLWVLSMSFHFVVTILLFLRRAATIVLCSNLFPESLVEGIKRHNGTFIYASPFHYNLLSRSEVIAPESMKKIRLAVSTAMKLPGETAERFYSKFGLELTEAYGIIEVGLPFIKLAADRNYRGTVGKALPDYQVEIRNKDADNVGEIYIKGKGMLDAYFSPWQNRSSILKEGWFKTGDLGKMDENGFLTIAGRDKDVINFTGMKIFAYEVEATLNQHPLIKESMVYGVSHPQYGQLPIARVVLKEGLDSPPDLDNLRRFCYERLAQYKVPKDFEFVSHLPKTASGKIKR